MPITARMHLKIWLSGDDESHSGSELVGRGRVELLRRTEALGSLKKAAESMDMSYRLAWGRIKKVEEALGLPLLESGAGRHGGSRLTVAGHALVEDFQAWEDKVRHYALLHAPTLPGLTVLAGHEALAGREAASTLEAPSSSAAFDCEASSGGSTSR